MPQGNVFTELNREYYALTAAEKKVADYVMLHQQNTQYMSISELAEEAVVAEATVSRFCRRLGYKGYNAFKLAVANTSAGRPSGGPLPGEVQPGDSVGDMCRKLFAVDLDAMSQTMEFIQPRSIVRAADLLLKARRVLCMGQGGSMIMAQEAAHLFSTVLPSFSAVSDSHFQAIRAALLEEGDVVFYFSYSGSTRDLVDLIKLAKDRGAGVILVTRFPKSPGAAYADVILECGSREGPLQLGSVAARIAQLYLLDVLFAEVCRRDEAGCRQRRARVAEALAGKHL